MNASAGPSLKARNLKWLTLLAVADAVLLGALASIPTAPGGVVALVMERIAWSSLAPLAVLLLVNVLPHDIKSMLVYWKPRGVLPGCEAFTKHARQDIRIDMAALARHVGVFPSAGAEQNALWYRLYKQVSAEPDVVDAHRHFLLYRDMAVLTLGVIVLAPLALAWFRAPATVWLGTAAFLIVQFLLTAISARWSGIRFVCNVLASHAAGSPVPAVPTGGA